MSVSTSPVPSNSDESDLDDLYADCAHQVAISVWGPSPAVEVKMPASANEDDGKDEDDDLADFDDEYASSEEEGGGEGGEDCGEAGEGEGEGWEKRQQMDPLAHYTAFLAFSSLLHTVHPLKPKHFHLLFLSSPPGPETSP